MATTQGQTPLRADSLFSCEGLVALVTGGGTGNYPTSTFTSTPAPSTAPAYTHPGIGYMIANALLQNGASKVYISGRRPDVLATAAQSLGPRAAPLVCDVTSTTSLSAAAEEVASSTGHLDLLVCNAGIGGPQVPAPSEVGSLEQWAAMNLGVDAGEYTKTFEVNVASAWYSVMAFLPLLGKGNERGGGWGSQVVVTSSIAAFNKMAPGGFAYGQSKAAVDLMVRQLAVALPEWGIRYVHASLSPDFGFTLFSRLGL